VFSGKQQILFSFPSDGAEVEH